MNFSFLADEAATFWFPPAASTFAERVDFLYMAILWISIVFFVPIVIAMVYFAIKFRARPGYKGSPEALHNTALEVTWTVLPTFLVVWIFWEGMMGYLDMARIPDDTIEFTATASKWNWKFRYENGSEDPVLYVPVNKNVKVILKSDDVLHSFYVPAFRIKRDVVPGRYHYSWFNATKIGVYDLFCAEYCGDNHSTMITKVHVLSEEDYKAKLADLAKEPEDLLELGKWVFEKKTCISCHYAGDEGARGPGPTYNGIWGKKVQLSNGTEKTVDENFIRDSILDPASEFRKGYETAAAMPSFAGQLQERHIEAIIAYIKSLETAAP